MSIFLAATAPSKATVHPLFSQRGITEYTQAPLSSIMVYGQPDYRELAYDGYVKNIDMFIAATNRGIKIKTEDIDGALDVTSRPLPLLKTPIVGFIPAVQMSKDQMTAFLTKLAPYKPSSKKRGPATTVITLTPNPKIIRNLLQTSHDNITPSPDFWTPKAYFAYVFCHTVISEFLATNSYCAFLEVGNDKGCPLGEVYVTAALKCIETKRKTSSMLEPMAPKKQKTQEEIDNDIEMDEDEDKGIDWLEYEPVEARELVYVAKPSPLPATNNIGPPSSVPHMPGLCFPYFDRMNIPDQTTSRGILARHFLRNFGSTRETQLATYKVVKTGLEQLNKTKEGGEIAHMLSGIELALSTQTRMYVVTTEGEYSGFCLLGARFSIVLNGVRHAWSSAEDLASEVAEMASHTAALTRICAALSRLAIVAGVGTLEPEEVKVDDVKNGWQLWEHIAIRNMKPSKDATIISESLGLLAFSRSYKEPTPENILAAMDRISGEESDPWPEETPCFLPSQFDLYNDKIARALAVFGSVTPSFINVKGSSFEIPVKSENDPNNKETEGKKKALPAILVSLKPMHVAVNDMKRFLKDRTLVMDLSERAAASRNLLFTGGARDKLYEGLRDSLNSYKERSKKRKADEEAGGKGKTAKTVSTAKDVLDLW